MQIVELERLWQERVREISAAWGAFSEPDRQRLRELSLLLMQKKGEIDAVAGRVDPASRCADCGGACCAAGKYHFTAVDLLAYRASEEPLFAPLFGNGMCPYLGEKGCLMPPAYRPFNCITFNCETIEDLLTAEEVSHLYRLERDLRALYGEIGELLPAPSLGGALLKDAPPGRGSV